MVSGLFITALSSGEFFGPLLVTTFTQLISYSFACTVMALIIFIILLPYTFFHYKHNNNHNDIEMTNNSY